MGHNATGHPNGVDHYGVKLDPEKVVHIRKNPDVPLQFFAKLFKCHPDTVRQARNKTSWKHVEDGKCPTCGRSYE